MENKFKIKGMHCGACQKVIEKKLSKVAGVFGVKAKLDGDVFVSANRTISSDEVRFALEGTDYAVS